MRDDREHASRRDGPAADSMRLGLNRHAELPGCDVARNDGEGAVGGQAVVPSHSLPRHRRKKEHQQESLTHRSTTSTELVVSRRREAAAHPDSQTGVVSGTAKEQRAHAMLFFFVNSPL